MVTVVMASMGIEEIMPVQSKIDTTTVPDVFVNAIDYPAEQTAVAKRGEEITINTYTADDFVGIKDAPANASSFLGVKFNVSDFSFASDSYVQGFLIGFNTSAPDTCLILMTSMNIGKEAGIGTNEVWIRIKVDGIVKLELFYNFPQLFPSIFPHNPYFHQIIPLNTPFNQAQLSK